MVEWVHTEAIGADPMPPPAPPAPIPLAGPGAVPDPTLALIAKLEATFDRLEKTDDRLSDKVLRKALSELPRAVDRLVGKRYIRRVWFRIATAAGYLLAGYALGNWFPVIR